MPTKMNVIAIMLDSLRQDHLGCYGNDWIETPNIDALAGESLRFDNFYPEGLPTLPVRKQLFTGQKTLPFHGWQPLLDEDITAAQILGHAGYLTALISDTYHLCRAGMNYHRGFHVFDWIRGQECDAYRSQPADRRLEDYIKPEIRNTAAAKALGQYLKNTTGRQGEEDYFVAQVMQRSIDWLKANRDSEPFFLWIDSFDPHEPWDAPPEFESKYLDPAYNGPKLIDPAAGFADWATDEEKACIAALYAAEVSFVDKWVGRLLDEVRNLGLLDNTLILLLSDHGDFLGEHNLLKKSENIPCLYNELVRLVLLVRHPEGEGRGRAQRALVQTPDLLPTILDVVGIGDADVAMHGHSAWPLVRGEAGKLHDYIITGYSDSNPPSRCIRDLNYSLLCKFERTGQELKLAGTELYDLEADPHEEHDLSEKKPDIVDSMAAHLGVQCLLRNSRCPAPVFPDSSRPRRAPWVKRPAAPRNVIAIMMDTLRADHVGCYGNQVVKTPHMDNLCTQSAQFTNAYPEGLPTLPVRRSVFTGQRTLPFEGWSPLGPTDVTITQLLGYYGYLTGLITDTFPYFQPPANYHQGFHTWEWIRGQALDHYRGGSVDEAIDPYFKEAMRGDVIELSLAQYLKNRNSQEECKDGFARKVVEQAINWLDRNAAQGPFFLWLDLFDPHEPWDPPAPYDTMYLNGAYNGPRLVHPKEGPTDWLTDEELAFIRAMYAGEVSYVDDCVGQLLAAASDTGLLENTVVVLLSDHGNPLGERGYLKKSPQQLYNEELRIPLMIRHPEGVGAGHKFDALVQVQDLPRTLLDILEIDTDFACHGESFWPVVQGRTDKTHDFIVSGWFDATDRCIRTQQWSLIQRPDGHPDELYDLENDPHELYNLIDEQTGLAEELKRYLGLYSLIRKRPPIPERDGVKFH